MPIAINTKANQYNNLFIFIYIFSILLISIKSLALKLYLTPSQSTILIPQLYIDQTIYTQYTIQGTSITIHPALQIIHTNQQLLQISKNSAEQLLVKIQHTVQDLHYMYYVSAQGCIKYSHIKNKVVQDILEICVDQGKKIQGLEIVNLKQLIVWSNRTVGVLKIDFNSQFPIHQVTNITYSFIKTDIPTSLPFNLNRCHKQTHTSYLCLTNQKLIQFNQTKTLSNDSTLQLVHIITPPQQLKCIINTCQLEDDIIGLCDCKKGCYNYQIIGNTLEQIIHKQILNSQQIIVMNIAQGGPKTVTMAIASQSILTLMKWSYNQIQVVDSMLLPDLNSGQLWDIIVSGDNICLKYKVKVNGNNYAYQHIFIKYDSIRLQYDQINIVLSQPYVFTFFRYVYSISYTGQLSLRMTNPYFLLVNYEEQLRSITIRAYNTGAKTKYRPKQVDNQTVQILIMPAIQGYVYVNQQLPKEVQMNYQYSYPMQLYQIFIGSLSKFVYTEQLLPFKVHIHQQLQNKLDRQDKQDIQDKQDRQDKQQQYNVRNKTTLYNYKDLRILSIYNLLQCVKLSSIGGGCTFRRYMANKNTKIYVQQCKSQQTQNNGDFICQIKQIIDSISHHQILNNQANNPKQHQNASKSNNTWKLVQIQLQKNKILFEIWKKQISQSQQQIIINTALYCYHFICHHNCYQILPTRYIILSTHNTTAISITLFNPFSINTTLIQYHLPIQLYPQLSRIKLSNINCQLVSRNIIYRYYKIVFGLHITNNKTIAFILQLRLSNFLQEQGISIMLSKVMQFQYYVMYFRIYSDYLYSFNSSHIIKSSLMTANGERLYTHVLQYKLGNPLQFVRNLGQYMLLVYQHSYRLLDLSGELISLIIDDKQNGGPTDRIKQFGNVGVYDIILFGTNTILLGINNMMRAYDRSISLGIGGYSMQDGSIRTQHLLTLSAFPLLQQNPIISQNFNLTISYQTSQVQIRGKAIKILDNLPYSAQNTTLVIFQTMFTGPIEQYYIADIYDGAIVLLNHIQKQYDVDNKQINRWISVNTTTYITQNNYKIMLKCGINVGKNIQNIQEHKLLYTNNTNFIIVSLKKQQIQKIFQLSQGQQIKYGQFIQYFQIKQQNQQDNFVIIFNKNCIVYLNYSSQYSHIKILNLKIRQAVQIIQAAIAGQGKSTKLYLILNQIFYNNNTYNTRMYQRSLYMIDFYKNDEQLIQTNLSHLKYFTVIYKTIIWVSQSQNKINQQPIYQLCIKKQNNQNIICQNLMRVIPQQYYLSQLSYYYKLIPISIFQQQNITIVRLLLLSKYSHAYHIDLILKYKQQYNKIINIKWQVTNCYVSLNQYITINFIGIFVNGTGYDYFILQYYKLEENNQEQSTILGFYRVNDEFNSYCGYVGGWYTVKDGQVANIVHVADQLSYPFIPHQSIMFTTLQVYHLYKNLTFVLNYDKPPKIPYSVINARNPSFYNKFYSKLIYQPDPDEKYLWIYCWVGFACVGICLGILKIISVMIDRGIITINKSLSEDDDTGGSPGVTVHYSGSGGMLTEQNSYKSLQSQQIS